jgi:hypothetical protein
MICENFETGTNSAPPKLRLTGGPLGMAESLEISARCLARALAWSMFLICLLLTGIGWLGWQVKESRDERRRLAAEVDKIQQITRELPAVVYLNERGQVIEDKQVDRQRAEQDP